MRGCDLPVLICAIAMRLGQMRVLDMRASQLRGA